MRRMLPSMPDDRHDSDNRKRNLRSEHRGKRNGKEIFGKLAQRVAVEKESGSLRSICRLLCTTSGDNVFLAHCQSIVMPIRQRIAALLPKTNKAIKPPAFRLFFTTHCTFLVYSQPFFTGTAKLYRAQYDKSPDFTAWTFQFKKGRWSLLA